MILAVTAIVYFGLVEPGEHKINFDLFRRRGGSAEPPRAAPAPMVFEGMGIKEIMRDKVFWLMLVTTLVSGVISSGMLATPSRRSRTRAFRRAWRPSTCRWPPSWAWAAPSLGGFLIDRFHTSKVAVPFHLITALGAFLLMTVTPTLGGKGMLFAAICCGGFAMAAALPMASYFQTRYFGLRSFAEFVGFTAMIQGLIMGFPRR